MLWWWTVVIPVIKPASSMIIVDSKCKSFPPLPWITDTSTSPETQKRAEGCEGKEVRMKHISQRKWQKKLQDIILEQFSLHLFDRLTPCKYVICRNWAVRTTTWPSINGCSNMVTCWHFPSAWICIQHFSVPLWILGEPVLSNREAPFLGFTLYRLSWTFARLIVSFHVNAEDAKFTFCKAPFTSRVRWQWAQLSGFPFPILISIMMAKKVYKDKHKVCVCVWSHLYLHLGKVNQAVKTTSDF